MNTTNTPATAPAPTTPTDAPAPSDLTHPAITSDQEFRRWLVEQSLIRDRLERDYNDAIRDINDREQTRALAFVAATFTAFGAALALGIRAALFH